ncbi:MAG: hypothetical protein WBA10_11700 [Elainellaceae cyanobacterium]
MIVLTQYGPLGLIVPILVSPSGVIGLHRLSLEPLRVGYRSDRSIVGECDRRDGSQIANEGCTIGVSQSRVAVG